MPPKIFILLLAITLAFSACDPIAGVSIINKTKTSKHIRVIYPPAFRNYPSDSLITYDNTAKDSYIKEYRIPVNSADLNNRTYSFLLQPGREVILEKRPYSSKPTFGQLVIINDTDTLEVKKHGKFVKRPKLLLGGFWTYTIKDK